MIRRWWNRFLQWAYWNALLEPLEEAISLNFNQTWRLIEAVRQEHEEQLGQLLITIGDLDLEIERMKNVIQERLPVNWDTIFPRGPKAFTHQERQ